MVIYTTKMYSGSYLTYSAIYKKRNPKHSTAQNKSVLILDQFLIEEHLHSSRHFSLVSFCLS